ncbi:MAG: RHS repeat-associated core domain-containing protein [Acidimicrobiia bacterium]|nr:RHS repeat-associated core domain-containing protein [Acidimicrobiia bacterium]
MKNVVGLLLCGALAVATLSGVELTTAAPAVASADPVADGGLFVPLQAAVFDSRTPAAGSSTTPPALTGGEWRDIQIGGVAGIPTTGVEAVALTFAVKLPASGGYVQATPTGVAPTNLTFLNYSAGGTESNSGILPLGTGGKISVKPRTSTHLLVDIQGYYTSGPTAAGGFVPITPTRLVDTRNGTGLPVGKVQSGATPTISASALAEVPDGASALAVNFGVTGQTASGYLTPYPADAALPTGGFAFPHVSADSFSAVVPLATTGTNVGKFKAKLLGGSTHLIVDVTGYFTAADSDGEGGSYIASMGGRIVDTRTATPALPPDPDGPASPLGAFESMEIQVTGAGGVPVSGAAALTATVAVVPGAAGGHLKAWRADDVEPEASVLNYVADRISSTTAIIALSETGTIAIHNAGSVAVHVVVDVQGWYVKPVVDDGEVDDWPVAEPGEVPVLPEVSDPANEVQDLPDVTLPSAPKSGSADLVSTWRTVGTSPVQVTRVEETSASVGVGWTPVVSEPGAEPSEFLITFGQAELKSGQTRVSMDAATETATTQGVKTRVPYGTFASAFGGNWSERLTVTAYPNCYLTTPEVEACADGVVVPTAINPAAMTLDFTAGPVNAKGTAAVSGDISGCFPDRSGYTDAEWTPETTDAPVEESAETVTDGMAEGPLPTLPAESSYPADTDVDEDLDEDNDGVEDVESAAGTAAEQPSAPGAGEEADVPVGGYGIASSAPQCRGLVYSVNASAGGYAASLSATEVNPSGSWQVGEGSGEFSWNYPFGLPAGMGDEAPALALSYSSGSVDGMSRVESGQASAAGLGWSMDPGYIARSYASCAKDGHRAKGDLCWKTLNGELVNELTISVAGHTSRLVQNAATNEWRMVDDPGWRFAYINPEGATGAPVLTSSGSPNNGDNNKEAFEVSSPDGTRYRFGFSPNSVWTAPVYGNNAGEPCHNAASAVASWCDQAWRWNLEKVISPNGNEVRYTYASESNHYKRWGVAKTPYVMAGRLAEINYGFPRLEASGQPARVRVVIESKVRCTPLLRGGSDADCSGNNGPRAKPKLWPDVPTDLICTSSGSCSNGSPSFFTKFRYDTVETRTVSQGSESTVDFYKLVFKMPDPDGSGKDQPDLWLDAITRTAGGVSLPAVEFGGVALRNRVRVPSGARSFRKFRIGDVRNELGGRVLVTYGHADGMACDAAKVRNRAPHQTGLECFAQQYAPPNQAPSWVWFHKYVVKSLTIGDSTLGLAGGFAPQWSLGSVQRIDYVYKGTPGWRFDDSRNVPIRKRGWTDWRGYGRVLIKTRNVDNNLIQPGSASIRRVVLYRGLSRSRTTRGGAFSTVKVATIQHGDSLEDFRRMAGRVAEESVLKGNGEWLTRTYHGYQSIRSASDGEGNHAHLVLENVTRHYTRVETGPKRLRLVQRVYHDGPDEGVVGNGRGLRTGALLETREIGTAAPDGGVCTITAWAAKSDLWIRAPRTVTMKDGPACGRTISHQVNYFDQFGTDSQDLSNGIERGNVTRVVTQAGEELNAKKIVTQSRYDIYGRLTKTIDARDKATTIAFEGASGGLGAHDRVRTVTTTGPAAGSGAAPVTTVVLDTRRGLPVQHRDENNRLTTMEYDGLGRLTKVKTPEKQDSNYASITYDYQVNGNRSSRVKTSVRRGVQWDVKYAFLDGWGRTIETQTRSPQGGRLVSSTGYDERGLAVLSVPVSYDKLAPGSGLLNPNPIDSPRYTTTEHDALGRPFRVTNKTRNTVRDQSVTVYQGNFIIARPARGGRTVTKLDSWERPIRVEQYDSNTAGDVVHAANYGYSGSGQLEAITSKVKGTDKTWTYAYDLAGRRIRTNDPDTGLTTYGYFNDQVSGNNNYTEVTSPTGNIGAATTTTTLRTLYDDRGRQIELRDVTGTHKTLSKWTYDTAANGTAVANGQGRLTSATSYTDLGDLNVTTKVNGYDKNGNTLGLTYTATINATTSLSSTETYTYTDDNLTKTVYSGVEGLPATTVTNDYTTNGVIERIEAQQAGDDQAYYLADATYYKNGTTRGLQSTAISDFNNTNADPRRLQRSYKWDETTGRLERIRANGFGALEYDYDLVGNPTKITATSGGKSAAWCYSYDMLNRLSTAKTGTATSTACGTQTDAAEEALTGGDQNLAYAYAEDRLTSVTSKTSVPAGQTATYNHQNNAIPHATSSIVAGPGVSSANIDPDLPKPAALTYDRAGRIKTQVLYPNEGSATETTDYTYGPRGELTQTTYPCPTNPSATATLKYAYDDAGMRAAREHTGCADPTTVYYLGTTEITTSTTGTALSARRNYATPNGTPLATQETAPEGASTWTWVLTDQQDNVRYTKKQTGGTTTRPTYLPFGEPTPTPAALNGARGYLNKPHDPNGDIRLDHRNYTPNLNTLTTPDPLLISSDPQSHNPYAYARNNPITLVDPSGLQYNSPDYGTPCAAACTPPSTGTTAVAATHAGYVVGVVSSAANAAGQYVAETTPMSRQEANDQIGAGLMAFMAGSADMLYNGADRYDALPDSDLSGAADDYRRDQGIEAGYYYYFAMIAPGFIPGAQAVLPARAANVAAKIAQNTRRVTNAAKASPSLTGKSYGLGTVVESPGLTIQGFRGAKNSSHALNQIINRGISPSMLRNTVADPKVVLRQGSGNFLHLSDEAAVVLRPDGQVVTAYGRADFRQHIFDIMADVG